MGKTIGSFLKGGIKQLATKGFWQGWLINAGLSLLMGTAANALRRKPRLGVESLDLGRNESDPVASLPVVYGAMRVGANIVFRETTDDNRLHWIVCALCHGAVAGIDAIYLDDTVVILADGRTSSAVLIEGTTYSFITYAHVWKAYGTDGQAAVVEKARGAKTTTTASHVGTPQFWDVTTSTAHGYQVGDMVEFTSSAPLVANRGYGIVAVPSSTKFTIDVPDGVPLIPGIATGGTVDHYTPDLATMFGSRWTARHRGRGIAYIVLRLWFNPERFPSVPKVEADVRGIAVRDSRTMATLTITTSAVGGAVTGYATTSTVNFSAAHGLAEGDIIFIAGHDKPELNGRQRVDRVVDTDTITIFCELSGAGSGGTAQTLEHSTNPAMCIRDYLTHGAYGVGATAAEINEAAFEDEANHQDEMVDVPVENDPIFTNLREVVDAVGDGVDTLFTTETPHGYAVSDVVMVQGFDPLDGINGIHTITAVPNPDEFEVALAVTGTFNPEVIPLFDPEGNPAGFGSHATVVVLADQKRFEISGVIDTTRSVKQNLSDLLDSCRAFLVYEGGRFRMFTRRPTVASALVLSKDNIVGDWEFNLPGQDEMANIVRANFFNARRGYTADSVDYPPPLVRNGFLEDDNFLSIRKDLDLRFVTNRSRAQQIAMVTRRESRNPITCAVTCLEAALALSVGDVVKVTHETPGWPEKEFWVGPMAIRSDGLLRIALHEYDETAYDLTADDEDPFPSDTSLSTAPALVTAVVTYTQFSTQSGADDYRYGANGLETTDNDEKHFQAVISLPRRAHLLAARARVFRDNASSNVELDIFAVDDDTGTVAIGAMVATTDGLSTLSDVLDYVVGEDLIQIGLTMESNDVTGGDAALLWVELDYSIASLDRTP